MMVQRQDEEFKAIHHTDLDKFDISVWTSRLRHHRDRSCAL